MTARSSMYTRTILTALTLLNRYAVFDTADNNILIKRIPMQYGIADTAVSWFSSCLTDRHQTLNVAK